MRCVFARPVAIFVCDEDDGQSGSFGFRRQYLGLARIQSDTVTYMYAGYITGTIPKALAAA